MHACCTHTAHSRQNLSFCFFSLGDSIPPDGDQLLSFPVLLLSYQPTEPALHVWPSELPATEQWHRLGSVPVCCTVDRTTFFSSYFKKSVYRDQTLNCPYHQIFPVNLLNLFLLKNIEWWGCILGSDDAYRLTLFILNLQACVDPLLWMWLRLLALITMSWLWLYKSRTWKWFAKITKKNKKLQERTTHERVHWTCYLITFLVSFTCVVI